MIEKKIQVNGISINYRENGFGNPLVLIHGMGSSIVFDNVIERLSKESRVIVIDLPGFGKSDKPDVDYTIDFFIKTLREFLGLLNIDKLILGGLSLGGQIASEFVYLFPEKIEKLIVISSAGLKSVATHIRYPVIYDIFEIIMRNVIFKRRDSLKKYLSSALYDKQNMTNDIIEKYLSYISSAEAQNAYFSALKIVLKTDPSFTRKLSNIKTKTLILWGENDPTFPIKYAQEFNRLLNNSELKIIPKCGHTITFEKPAEFCDFISEFIKN